MKITFYFISCNKTFYKSITSRINEKKKPLNRAFKGFIRLSLDFAINITVESCRLYQFSDAFG